MTSTTPLENDAIFHYGPPSKNLKFRSTYNLLSEDLTTR
jgi:hypothetical protein